MSYTEGLVVQSEDEAIGPKNGTSNFDREVGEKIIFAFNIGATTSLALKFAGASIDGFKKWKKLAKEGVEPYTAFFKILNKTRGNRAVKWLEQIEAAAEEGKWQAAAWKLSHCEPEDYGNPEGKTKNKIGNTNVQVNFIASLSNSELREREMVLRRLLEKIESVQGRVYLEKPQKQETLEYPLYENELQIQGKGR